MSCLYAALETMPIGTANAVWNGIGHKQAVVDTTLAVLTVTSSNRGSRDAGRFPKTAVPNGNQRGRFRSCTLEQPPLHLGHWVHFVPWADLKWALARAGDPRSSRGYSMTPPDIKRS